MDTARHRPILTRIGVDRCEEGAIDFGRSAGSCEQHWQVMQGKHPSCQQRTSSGAPRYEGTHEHRWSVKGREGKAHAAAFDDDDGVPQSGEGLLGDAEWLPPECVCVASPGAILGRGGDAVFATMAVQVDCVD